MRPARELAFLLLSFSWLGTFYEQVHGAKDEKPSRSVFTKGDFIIGGLSPVHFSPTAAEEQADPDSFMCQGGFNTRGFEAVEAMLFAMDMLNEGPLKNQLLPNVTIGMDIKDTCTSSDYAVRESLNFTFIRNANVKDECSGVPRQREQHTIAVVGAAYSGVSMAVTNLCGLFYVPLVSYASTSRLLSSKVRFRYFLRTVPSDMLQAQVMADLVRAMNWNFVIALSSDTEYGRSGIEAFKLALASYKGDYDICIPVDEKFTKRSPSSKFERIFRLMKANAKAKVVILFAELHDAKFLIDLFAKREDLAKEKYVWIGSDAWADAKQVLKGNEHVLKGMLGVVPEVKHIKQFDEYFVDFNEHRRRRNPWMREYEQIKVAHNPGFHRQAFRHYPKAQYVMEAVLAVAHALHDMLGCVPYEDCSKKVKTFSQRNQKDFLGHLQKVRFCGMTREVFSFDQLGDAIGVYDIHQLTLVGANYDFVNFGKWGLGENCKSAGKNISSPCLKLSRQNNINNEFWRNSSDQDNLFSRCSADCPPGFRIDPQNDHAKCCWECIKCRGKTITDKPNLYDCQPCPSGYWATANQSSCEPISPTYLTWTDAPAVIIMCISAVGLLGVICTFYVFYCFRDTPVVRASSRELCYVLLIGIGWCFITPLFFIAEPTDKICRAIPVVTGLCPALVVGTLLTKTNRISRIFNKKLIKTGTPSFLSKKWQLLMILCVCLLECIISVGTVYTNAAGSQILISNTKREVIKQCKEISDISVAIWWVYNTGLVMTCTYQAFLTRKLPENYNEAKFITFTMLTTCIVVIIFIPTYIGTSGIYRTTITCFVFVIAGFAGLACMFVPKVYIILWRPQKNVPMQPRSTSVRLGTISPSASFVRRLSVDNSSVVEDKSTRSQGIRSLPLIQTPPEEEQENDSKAPIRKRRSASMNSEILRENVPSSPYTGNARRTVARSVKVTIERIKEELNEYEPSDTESTKLTLESLFENQPIAAVKHAKKDTEEYLELNGGECHDNSCDDTHEFEATEADRLLAFYQDCNEDPTTCTERSPPKHESVKTSGDYSALHSMRDFTKNKPKEPLNAFRLPYDSEHCPNTQISENFSKVIPRLMSNPAATKSAHANRGQRLVGVPPVGSVNSSTGTKKERHRKNAVCQKDLTKLNDGNGNEKLESTKNGVCPQCNQNVLCQLTKRPRSQDELGSAPHSENSPEDTLCCASEENQTRKFPSTCAIQISWFQALSKGAGYRNHARSAPSLADGISVCDGRQGDGDPETIL